MLWNLTGMMPIKLRTLPKKVSNKKAESIFWDSRKVQHPDPFHSVNERRFVLIGRSKNKRLLFVVYTIRKTKIRIISARPLNKKEKHLYEKTT